MNAFSWVLKIITLVPMILAGIQQVHADKDKETKAQIANETLGLAVQGAKATAPEHSEAIDAAATAATAIINASDVIAHDGTTGSAQQS